MGRGLKGQGLAPSNAAERTLQQTSPSHPHDVAAGFTPQPHPPPHAKAFYFDYFISVVAKWAL